MLPLQEVPLTYTVAYSTPHSGRYSSEHILVDNPSDQNSRWSGAYQGTPKQWLLLRLETLAVLRRITFGKFSKPHPCNMKEFKVYIGMTEDNMVEVIHSGLKNNAEPESFEIKHVNGAGTTIPTRYVKIEPIASHGPSFHSSIWYVAMAGYADREYIDQVQTTYEEQREQTILRHILKHLRQRRLLTPFKSITERSDLRLEHPLVSKLHETLVLQGDWKTAEQLLSSLSDGGLFTNYLNSCQPLAFWTRITGTDADGDVPSPRGGHAMCMDPEKQIVYLFGGWDGQKSLDDFWAYHVKQDKWHLLSSGTSKEPNAPGARSCHKMVFDSKTGNIYLLGRLDDSDVRVPNSRPGASTQSSSNLPPVPSTGSPPHPSQQASSPSDSQNTTPTMAPTNFYCSEFYRYQTRGLDAGKWVFLSFDTASSGGPPLVFDHQMVIDSESQMLYMFGGRVVDGNWETAKYAGLYSYNVRKSKWRLLQAPDPSGTLPNTIPPRFGHSMVLEPKAKQLFIFGGQREQRYLSDMYVYDLNTGISKELYSNFTTSGGPDPCFTQRSVIDPLLKEIYVFCGLTRSPTIGPQSTALQSNPSSWVYRYGPKPGKWSQILRHPDSSSSEVPLPRFAHQVVYHPTSRTVFLHGGNAGGLAAVDKEKEKHTNNSVAVNSNPDANPPSQDGNGNRNGSPVADGSGSGVDPGRSQAPVPTSSPGPVTVERRLDDFWKLELRRPQVEEVIRKAKFHIRQQQFREMCEEISPVQALQFLQTQISSVVDHKDPEETEAFRSLLTHLLEPPSKRTLPIPAPTNLQRSSSQASDTSGLSPEASTRESTRGKRRLSDETGTWTSFLPGEGDQADDISGDEIDFSSSSHPRPRGTASVLRGIVDPLELAAYDLDEGSTSTLKPLTLTSERYQQRTDAFSRILEFVSEGEKEPEGDLLHLLTRQDSA